MKEPKVKEYDIEEMSLFQIECKIEEINNAACYYLEKLEFLKRFQRPRTSQLQEILAHGGDATNAFDTYVDKSITAEQKGYKTKYQALKAEAKILENYLERQKAIISKYELKDQEIIYLKEKNYSWLYIANKVNYSIRQCQRKYNEYLETRKKD